MEEFRGAGEPDTNALLGKVHEKLGDFLHSASRRTSRTFPTTELSLPVRIELTSHEGRLKRYLLGESTEVRPGFSITE